MCSASTMHRALIDSGLKSGQWVVFPGKPFPTFETIALTINRGGGGGVGIQGVQLAKAMGMRPIAIDTGAAKKKLTLEMGAEKFIDFKEVQDVAAAVVETAGKIGAHGVIVTAPQAYANAVSYIGNRISGVVVCVGLRMTPSIPLKLFLTDRLDAAPKGSVNIGADPCLFSFKNLRIMGSLVGTMQDTEAALCYAQRGLLKQICEVRGLSQMPESVQQLRRGEIPGRIVIDFNKP